MNGGSQVNSPRFRQAATSTRPSLVTGIGITPPRTRARGSSTSRWGEIAVTRARSAERSQLSLVPLYKERGTHSGNPPKAQASATLWAPPRSPSDRTAPGRHALGRPMLMLELGDGPGFVRFELRD